MISPNYNKELGRVKDITSAAVLLGAFLSAVVGILILYKPIINALKLAPESVLISLVGINIFLIAVILFTYYIKKK